MYSTSGGVLFLTVKEARLTRDTETFGKMDPYCKIDINGHVFKTRVHQNGGKNPRWGDQFEIPVSSMNDDIKFHVMDEDVTSSDFIGMTVLKVSSLTLNNGVNDWFEVTYKAKSAGSVHLQSRFQPYNQGSSNKQATQQAHP